MRVSLFVPPADSFLSTTVFFVPAACLTLLLPFPRPIPSPFHYKPNYKRCRKEKSYQTCCRQKKVAVIISPLEVEDVSPATTLLPTK